MIQIAPSILSADFARLGEEIRAVEEAGADFIHVDVMDGHFVPNLTIGPPVVQALGKVAKKPLDVHLMISPVDAYLPDFAKARPEFLTIHAEATHHLDRSLNHIRELGCRPGVALNPGTPLCNLGPVLHLVDMVLIMSVNPGFGGQSFIPQTLRRVERAARMLAESGREIILAVDGGIKPDNIGPVAKAGARFFVAGSAVFNEPDYRAVITALKNNGESACR
ncbi:MAG: ribulose-phosphate 3-epimerase [Magnetococcales bacterium]|nr:ribulose-phosphate 3-epimerase [Magnetococcales bacterium]